MAFSYQSQHPFFIDSAYLPHSPMGMPLLQHDQVGEDDGSSSFSYFYSSGATPEVPVADARAHDSSSSLDTSTYTPSVETSTNFSPLKMGECHNEKHSQGCKEKKRKKTDESSLITSQPKSTKKSKSCNQERERSGQKETEKKKKPKADDAKASMSSGDPPAGYIHVRARRGQATDSHSLAERVRREKISERMKMLQGLVPGCDQVTGKAHMLDEIINYVQSLQSQVEFLSLRLASLSPVLYDFGLDFDDCINQPEKTMRRMTQVTSMDQVIDLQPTTYENGTTNNYQMMMDHLVPHLVQEPGPASFTQNGGSFVMQIDAQRQVFLNQREFVNMCSFQ